MWSPQAFCEARARMSVAEQEKQADELKRAEMKELAAANKLYKAKIAEEKRVARVREKEERDQLKAVKAAEAAERKAQKERDKQGHNAKEAIKFPQRGKRKASQVAAPRKKQKRGRAVACSQRIVHERSPSPPPTYNSRGRRIAPRKKFE